MRKCPYCGKENPDDATVCALDQTPLMPEAESSASRKFSKEEIRVHLAARPLAVKFAVGLLAFVSGFDLIRITIKNHSYLSRHADFGLSIVWTSGLVALLLYFVFRGKNWARWAVLCGLILSIFPTASVHQIHWESYFYLAIDFVAVGLLFQRSSNEWFAGFKKVSAQLLPSI